jgi:hypothetical protein
MVPAVADGRVVIAASTICELANNFMGRGRLWHVLQAQSSAMCENGEPSARECTSRIFPGCPDLITGLQRGAVLRVL